HPCARSVQSPRAACEISGAGANRQQEAHTLGVQTRAGKESAKRRGVHGLPACGELRRRCNDSAAAA
ncbi:MAG: hypothetical protein ACRC1H_13170, partial [Caldilineaceae bacterium]